MARPPNRRAPRPARHSVRGPEGTKSPCPRTARGGGWGTRWRSGGRGMRVVVMGAAGRDFHVFNTVHRDDPTHEVVAFTAAQIPGIDDRRHPAPLAGEQYPKGILHARQQHPRRRRLRGPHRLRQEPDQPPRRAAAPRPGADSGARPPPDAVPSAASPRPSSAIRGWGRSCRRWATGTTRSATSSGRCRPPPATSSSQGPPSTSTGSSTRVTPCGSVSYELEEVGGPDPRDALTPHLVAWADRRT